MAYAALIVAMGGTAYAATGGSFILGHTNKADQASTLQNTGSGSALHLVTNKGGVSPFTVSNGTKVHKLNADKIDGLSSGQLQRKLPTRLSFTKLNLINGWTSCPSSGTGAPGVALDRLGVVHFHGAVCTNLASSNTAPFVLAAKFRPTKPVYVVVDFCNAATGRMYIPRSGAVRLDADPNPVGLASPQCFTSLAGVTYTLPY